MRFESVEAVAAFVPPGIIGIVGAPGAGKSTIGEQLVALLPEAVLLPMDGYHLPQARLVELGRRDRMGAPDTFDVAGFVQTLTTIARGELTLAPAFDRTIEEPVPDAITIPPQARNVVVEGNYLLLWPEVAELLDVSFFVEVPRGIRQQRLIDRHVRFGKSPADATAWALGPDESNALAIEATAPRADHTIALPG